ncbi:prenyltransferase [Hydrogenophaga sp.]|uniref:prenyltransferase n=1 Tax=Hydrogenophaga sp. TaxID=1904254 RepID=UPI0026121170|nr:prenyltransferase [Hydrogenophaga sp.]MDM7951078.1 prenyltransferase [Hydrogenophaga sp.]
MNALHNVDSVRRTGWAQAWLWWRMTRPGFLLLTVVACALGTATAAACGCGLSLPLAAASTVLAVLVHATGNVFNDLHDARNGADATNTQGISPFTGGSRLIQTGQVTERETDELAKGLLILLVPAGLWLAAHIGSGKVLLLGAAGVALAWAYSAPPLRLMSRGLGELTVALVWFLVVIGADLVQRQQWFLIPASVALNFSGLVAALLLINGFVDAKADARVGKRTLVVLLGPDRASLVYLALVVSSHLWLWISVMWLIPPAEALWGLVSAPLSLFAAALLRQNRYQPQRLRLALQLSVTAVLVHGLAMTAGFVSLSWYR